MKIFLAVLLLATIVGCQRESEPLADMPSAPDHIPSLPSDPIEIDSQDTSTPPPPEFPDPIALSAGQSLDLEPFGLAPYPNQSEDSTASNSSTKTTNQKTELSLTFNTPDSPATAADFYAGQIASQKSKSVTKDTAVVGGITKTGASVFIVASKIGSGVQVSITASRSNK